MSLGQAYLDDILLNFRKHKDLAEQAVRQVSDEDFFRKPGPDSNSIALILKHVAGNLASRWTDFLTSDGDKPWRDRDNEFVIGPEDTREHLLAAWEKAWSVLFDTLHALREADLLKSVPIRGEPHSVVQALDRSLAHTAYHVGQIVYLARLLTRDGWQWLTIPPGQSGRAREHGGGYLK
jgi:uncharacterized damage-inducible protein DinB